jgi:hypothetical protein
VSVTAGAYVTEAMLLGRLAGAQLAQAFTSTTVPTDGEISRFIVESEARVSAHLAGAGFSLPIVGGNAIIYVQLLATAIVAGRVAEAQIDSRQSDQAADSFAVRLQAEGWAMLWAVIGDPTNPEQTGNYKLLTEAGLTSSHSAVKLVASWETENASVPYATTPNFNYDTEF